MISVNKFAFEVKTDALTSISLPFIPSDDVMQRVDLFLKEADRYISAARGLPYERKSDLDIEEGWDNYKKNVRAFLAECKNIEINFATMFSIDEDGEGPEFEICEFNVHTDSSFGIIKLEPSFYTLRERNPLKLKTDQFDSTLLSNMTNQKGSNRVYCVASVAWILSFDSYLGDYGMVLGTSEAYLIGNL